MSNKEINFDSQTGEPLELKRCSYCGDEWKIYEDWKFALYTKQFKDDERPEYACCLQCLRMIIFNILPKTHAEHGYFRLQMICCNSDYIYEFFSLQGLRNMFNQMYLEIAPVDSDREKIVDEKELQNYHFLLVADSYLREKLEELENEEQWK